MPEPTPALVATEQMIAEAIAEAFTSEFAGRNPTWDIDTPDGPDNEYHLRRRMSERVLSGPMVHFTAGDGCRSFRSPTCQEIATVVAAALTNAAPANADDARPGGER